MPPRLSPTRHQLVPSFAVALLTIAASQQVAAFTAFSENFESYAGGSDLIGQGGWFDSSGFIGSEARVMTGTYLPGKVLDGRNSFADNPAIGNFVTRDIGSLDPDLITVLRFDAYATMDSPATNGAIVALAEATGVGFVSAGWQSIGGVVGGRWDFIASNASNSFSAAGGYDMPVRMGVVVDGVTNEIYGTYDFGGGPLETPRVAVSDADILVLDRLLLYIGDGSGFGPPGFVQGGVEIDNISVAPVPIPAAAPLLGVGIAALFGVARRRRSPVPA